MAPAVSGAIFLDAGVLIGALVQSDPRHAEALPIVEAARRGAVPIICGPAALPALRL